MATHDLLLRYTTPAIYELIGRDPFFRTAGVDKSTSDGYDVWVNNSLEGSLFDDSTNGYVTTPGGFVHPNFGLDYTATTPVAINLTSVSRTNGIVSVTTQSAHGLSTNDFFTFETVTFDSTHTYALNGTFQVYQVIDSTNFTFIKRGEDFASSYYSYPMLVSLTIYDPVTYPILKIYDNRQSIDSSELSYNGILLSPKDLTSAITLRRRITPSDFYIRFKFEDSTGTLGGLNSNVFNVIDDTANENIKPIIWAWFFGGVTKSTASSLDSADRDPNNIFDIVFNSYALVLRPTGNGAYLEFALLKFNWGQITSGNWFSSFIDTALINKYDDVDGADLGYLIATNPNVAQIGGNPRVVEIANSSSFLYDSEQPLKLNLKISVRKHFLSDQLTEDSYYFQLAVNQDYETFGEGALYSNIMHAYIKRPKMNGLEVTTLASGGYTNAITTDLGKDVLDGATPIGILSWYDNTNRVWWIKGASSRIASSTALTIDAGTGAGTTNILSYDDSGLKYINPLNGDATNQANYLFLQWMYFKFINASPTLFRENSSIIQIDNILFRQMNSNDKNYY